MTTFPFAHIAESVFTSVGREGHPLYKGDVIIGHDVWIGYGATIMGGVKIGNGAVDCKSCNGGIGMMRKLISIFQLSVPMIIIGFLN